MNKLAVIIGIAALAFPGPVKHQPLKSQHWHDAIGTPNGGFTEATGISIRWQAGPRGQGADEQEANGAEVEDVIRAAISRLEFYQRSRFACEENRLALEHLRYALTRLDQRTLDRQRRGVAGTNSK